MYHIRFLGIEVTEKLLRFTDAIPWSQTERIVNVTSVGTKWGWIKRSACVGIVEFCTILLGIEPALRNKIVCAEIIATRMVASVVMT